MPKQGCEENDLTVRPVCGVLRIVLGWKALVSLSEEKPCRLKEQRGLEITVPLDFVKLRKGELGRAPKC